MKNSRQTFSQILAAGLAGVALSLLAQSAFVAALPVELLTAIALSAAILGLAVYDYSRHFRSLNSPGRVLRPLVPCAKLDSSGSKARSARNDRAAA